jgi:uncharacterized protein (DUF433 family)
MTLPDFLRADSHGEIFLAGHRITLYHLIKDYQEGATAELLAAAYPTLPLALVHKVLAFYLENQEAADQYVAETRQEIGRQAGLPQAGPTLAELKRRLQAKGRAESA